MTEKFTQQLFGQVNLRKKLSVKSHTQSLLQKWTHFTILTSIINPLFLLLNRREHRD